MKTMLKVILKVTCLSVGVLLATSVFGQQDDVSLARSGLNAGFQLGGGPLFRLDYEYMLSKRVGVQVGAGLPFSAGTGINYHFKRYINSSFLSVAYWHQGFGDNYYASYLGPMFVYRAKRIFQFGIGGATVLSTGPQWESRWENRKEPSKSFVFIANIGIYFPLN